MRPNPSMANNRGSFIVQNFGPITSTAERSEENDRLEAALAITALAHSVPSSPTIGEHILSTKPRQTVLEKVVGLLKKRRSSSESPKSDVSGESTSHPINGHNLSERTSTRDGQDLLKKHVSLDGSFYHGNSKGPDAADSASNISKTPPLRVPSAEVKKKTRKRKSFVKSADSREPLKSQRKRKPTLREIFGQKGVEVEKSRTDQLANTLAADHKLGHLQFLNEDDNLKPQNINSNSKGIFITSVPATSYSPPHMFINPQRTSRTVEKEPLMKHLPESKVANPSSEFQVCPDSNTATIGRILPPVTTATPAIDAQVTIKSANSSNISSVNLAQGSRINASTSPLARESNSQCSTMPMAIGSIPKNLYSSKTGYIHLKPNSLNAVRSFYSSNEPSAPGEDKGISDAIVGSSNASDPSPCVPGPQENPFRESPQLYLDLGQMTSSQETAAHSSTLTTLEHIRENRSPELRHSLTAVNNLTTGEIHTMARPENTPKTPTLSTSFDIHPSRLPPKKRKFIAEAITEQSCDSCTSSPGFGNKQLISPVSLSHTSAPNSPNPTLLSTFGSVVARQSPVITASPNSSTSSPKLSRGSSPRPSPTDTGASPEAPNIQNTVAIPNDSSNKGPIVVDPQRNLIMLHECQMAVRPDEDGDMPIHIAVVQCDLAVVRRLIPLMDMLHADVDYPNQLRQTPLHLAVITRQVDMVMTLLSAGASPMIPDRKGHNAIHLSILHDSLQVLGCLLTHLSGTANLKLDATNYEGYAPLHLAVLHNNANATELLLQHGADVNIMDGKSGRTPLYHAAETHNYKLAKILVEKKANVNLASYSGTMPVQVANSRGYSVIVALLVKHGADTSLTPASEASPSDIIDDPSPSKAKESGKSVKLKRINGSKGRSGRQKRPKDLAMDSVQTADETSLKPTPVKTDAQSSETVDAVDGLSRLALVATLADDAGLPGTDSKIITGMKENPEQKPSTTENVLMGIPKQPLPVQDIVNALVKQLHTLNPSHQHYKVLYNKLAEITHTMRNLASGDNQVEAASNSGSISDTLHGHQRIQHQQEVTIRLNRTDQPAVALDMTKAGEPEDPCGIQSRQLHPGLDLTKQGHTTSGPNAVPTHSQTTAHSRVSASSKVTLPTKMSAVSMETKLSLQHQPPQTAQGTVMGAILNSASAGATTYRPQLTPRGPRFYMTPPSQTTHERRVSTALTTSAGSVSVHGISRLHTTAPPDGEPRSDSMVTE